MINLTLAICMYNAERYIEETLQSVMAQTMQNFHLLIINDCSTDSSANIVKKFFQRNPRQYELQSFKENHGICYTRNFALNYSKTIYLLFIDADDIINKNMIEEEYTTISSDKDLMGVSCWSEYIDERGKKIYGGTFLGSVTKHDFIQKAKLAKLIFLPIHTMFNRELAIKSKGFNNIGFPVGKPRLQDYCEELDLWTRMSDYFRNGKAFITIPKILYQYRKRNGLSSNHFYMILKMRYTKTNLLLRRKGLKELSFIEFYSKISKKELKKLRIDASAADNLRNAVFYFKQREIPSGIICLIHSVGLRPLYIIDKIRHNLLRSK